MERGATMVEVVVGIYSGNHLAELDPCLYLNV